MTWATISYIAFAVKKPYEAGDSRQGCGGAGGAQEFEPRAEGSELRDAPGLKQTRLPSIVSDSAHYRT